MDYSNYNNYANNSYANYQMQQQPQMQLTTKRKIEVKSLILTILCIVTSLITAFSTLMPMMSINYTYASEGINIIDIVKGVVDVIGSTYWSMMDAWEIVAAILIITIMFVPVAISAFGLVAAFVYVIKLIAMKPVKKVSGFTKCILIMEMIFAAFMYFVFYIVIDTSRLSDDYLSGATLSVGWYLPVIFVIIIMLLKYVFDVMDKMKEEGKTKENVIAAIFGGVGAIVSVVMYLAFAFTQFVVIDDGVEIKLSFSYFHLLTLEELFDESFEILTFLMVLFIITIAFLSRACLSRMIKKPLKSKVPAVFAIVTGALAIGLSITNYILFSVFVEERVGTRTTMEMGASNYLYIIFGAILIILGIAYLCVKVAMNNNQTVPYNVQGAAYYQQQPAQQYGQQDYNNQNWQ